MELPASIYENEIRRGRILHSDSFVNIGHGKFFAIIGITEDSIVGFFFVNSNINKYIQDKPEMMAVQYPLRKQDYGFLRYDSFLCATEVEEIKKSDILEGISNGSVIFVDELKKEHLDEVLNMVRYPPHHKKSFPPLLTPLSLNHLAFTEFHSKSNLW